MQPPIRHVKARSRPTRPNGAFRVSDALDGSADSGRVRHAQTGRSTLASASLHPVLKNGNAPSVVPDRTGPATRRRCIQSTNPRQRPGNSLLQTRRALPKGATRGVPVAEARPNHAADSFWCPCPVSRQETVLRFDRQCDLLVLRGTAA